MIISENYPFIYINMCRSYFRCVNKTCKARKKLEWPPNEPNNIETTYEGDHNHRDRSENEEAGIAANQYDLATQMFGSART
ncbi:WRKY transcription factor 44 [Dendrobium catenatum]|uniref:WRKY transcription factor 44 n=1 Tax=Dendrobium catenatum TaxID=906689 RepID=A0A2I0VZU8_9ASPA|nr:WRKY transcription factor 44 [Dendrobium catenatum]